MTHCYLYNLLTLHPCTTTSRNGPKAAVRTPARNTSSIPHSDLHNRLHTVRRAVVQPTMYASRTAHQPARRPENTGYRCCCTACTANASPAHSAASMPGLHCLPHAHVQPHHSRNSGCRLYQVYMQSSCWPGPHTRMLLTALLLYIKAGLSHLRDWQLTGTACRLGQL